MASTWRNNSLTRRLHQVPARIVLRNCVQIRTYGTEAAMGLDHGVGHSLLLLEGVSELLIWYPPWKMSATSFVGGEP